MAKPLAGIRIADFSYHAACPFAMHLLSLMGAEVIKVESRMRLDTHHKPNPVYGRAEAPAFYQVAANKLSVSINLKDPRGVELAKRIAGICDMVAESMRPDVMTRLGIGYEQLRAVRPNIIMLSLSACGQTGPDRNFAGYAPLFGAWGGLGYLTGYADGPPVELRHIMDHSCGLTATLAAIAALYHLRTTGDGQHVDVSAREVASSFIGEALVLASTGSVPKRLGNADEMRVPHGVYPCREADTWVSVAVDGDVSWKGLVAALGDACLAEERFLSAETRVTSRDLIDATLNEWTRSQTPESAAETLQAHGVAAFPSMNSEDIVHDPHLRARRTIVDLVVGEQTRAVVGSPFKFSKSEAGIERGHPTIGQHNDYVFGELLGMSQNELRELERERVLY